MLSYELVDFIDVKEGFSSANRVNFQEVECAVQNLLCCSYDFDQPHVSMTHLSVFLNVYDGILEPVADPLLEEEVREDEHVS